MDTIGGSQPVEGKKKKKSRQNEQIQAVSNKHFVEKKRKSDKVYELPLSLELQQSLVSTNARASQNDPYLFGETYGSLTNFPSAQRRI